MADKQNYTQANSKAKHSTNRLSVIVDVVRRLNMTYTACSKGNVLSIIGLSWPAATNLATSFMQRPSGAPKIGCSLGPKPVMLQNSLQITRFTRSLWLLAWLLTMHVQQLA